MKALHRTKFRTGTGLTVRSRFLFSFPSLAFVALALFATACSLLHTRPVQTMSDTGAAIRAAKEVQSDTLAPELYRQANEWFFRAKNEYKFKNFKQAEEYAVKSRLFAEQAEFEAIRNGGSRSSIEAITDPLANAPAAKTEPYEYPSPVPTPFEAFPRPTHAPTAPDVPKSPGFTP